MPKTTVANKRTAGIASQCQWAVIGAILIFGMASFVNIALTGLASSAHAREKGEVAIQLAAVSQSKVASLAFEDPVSVIPAEAIDRLIMSGNVMGSRLRLKSGMEVYFPDGFVVLAEWQSMQTADIQALQQTGYANRFGRQCAGETGPRGQWMMFRGTGGTYTLVEELGDSSAPEGIRLTEVLDPDFLPKAQIVQALLSQCR